MFSKLRKLVGKDEDARKSGEGGLGRQGGDGNSSADNGVRALQPQLQRKFARGIQYNMKIVIRGDKNVGKTCLWLRLQGLPFREEYLPSDEIQVTNIQWSFKASDDVVKVEIWDVVDKSKKRRTITALKLNNAHAAARGDEMKADSAENNEVGLDAETLDVYKGTHGVILVMDLTKPWTFDYVKQEAERLPSYLPVLILVNHRDMGHHQSTTVNLEQVKSFVQHLDRGDGLAPAPVIVAESSMRNGFGLKYLHKFFNLPFLQLQRDALETQLQHNLQDMETTHQELESLLESEEQNYELFIQTLGEKRRKDADKLAPPPPPVPVQMPPSPTASGAPPGGPPGGPAASPRMHAPPAHLPLNGKSNAKTAGPEPSPSKGGFFSRKNNGPNSSTSAAPKSAATDVPAAKPAPFPTSQVKHIDEFIPDDYIPGEFLEETRKSPVGLIAVGQGMRKDLDSSDEEDAGNPMVAGFTDEVELDVAPTRSFPVTTRLDITGIPLASSQDVQKQTPDSPTTLRQDNFSSTEPGAPSLPAEKPLGSPANVITPPTTPEVPGELETWASPVMSEHAAVTPIAAITAASPSIQFDTDEFSTWLTNVEKRDTQKASISRKHSAGLVTATSLDDSRTELLPGVDQGVPDSGAGDSSFTTDVIKPTKKKAKKGKTTKVKVEKSSKKSAADLSMPADSTKIVAASVSPVKSSAPSIKKELSEKDHSLVMERELEDFLASDHD